VCHEKNLTSGRRPGTPSLAFEFGTRLRPPPVPSGRRRFDGKKRVRRARDASRVPAHCSCPDDDPHPCRPSHQPPTWRDKMNPRPCSRGTVRHLRPRQFPSGTARHTPPGGAMPRVPGKWHTDQTAARLAGSQDPGRPGRGGARRLSRSARSSHGASRRATPDCATRDVQWTGGKASRDAPFSSRDAPRDGSGSLIRGASGPANASERAGTQRDLGMWPSAGDRSPSSSARADGDAGRARKGHPTA
jgi:hypothetical protein